MRVSKSAVMFKKPLPPLTLALASAASVHLERDEPADRFAERFRHAVAEMDRADRNYRRAIEKTLPRESAQVLLAAMDAFRKRVGFVRENARSQISDIYRRYDRVYGSLDPLDPSAPFASGLSHVDGTRVAGIADSARSEVESLRSQVNGAVMRQLRAEHVETLMAAKRERRSAFESALKHVLERSGIPPAPKTVYQLAELAEGWY
jgi:hypothetical protein